MAKKNLEFPIYSVIESCNETLFLIYSTAFTSCSERWACWYYKNVAGFWSFSYKGKPIRKGWSWSVNSTSYLFWVLCVAVFLISFLLADPKWLTRTKHRSQGNFGGCCWCYGMPVGFPCCKKKSRFHLGYVELASMVGFYRSAIKMLIMVSLFIIISFRI